MIQIEILTNITQTDKDNYDKAIGHQILKSMKDKLPDKKLSHQQLTYNNIKQIKQ